MQAPLPKLLFHRLLPALLTCAGLATAQESSPAPGRPNIVVILVDDAGTEVFPAWGGTAYETPHIDALAASGMRFTQAHAYPICTPSRVALMTGRDGLRNYVKFGILDPAERTFAHSLQAAGYATCVVGKWQLFGPEFYGDWAGRGTRPEGAGFDRWCLWQVADLGERYRRPSLEVDGTLYADLPRRYGPDQFVEYALKFLRENRERPFLLYYPMALVHGPFQPTPITPPDVEGDRQSYFADMVGYADHLVGRLVGCLDELGLRERTLILFTSDNGTDRSIRVPLGEGYVQGGKGKPISRGTRVPLAASWPGTVPAGSVYEGLTDFTDFLPTLCEVAGAATPEGVALDGKSFAPQLLGSTEVHRRVSFAYYNPRPYRPSQLTEKRWAFTTRYKLYSDGRLYHTAADPEETSTLDHYRLDPQGAEDYALLRAALDAAPGWPERIPREVLMREPAVEAVVPDDSEEPAAPAGADTSSAAGESGG